MRLDEAVARVRALIDGIGAFKRDRPIADYADATWDDVDTLLAALPTPEERVLLETLADECKSVASQTRDYLVREVYTARAAILRALLTRTGGATDGE